MIGIPYGINSKYMASLQSLVAEKGLQLEEGKGNDADTLLKKKVWVLDSNKSFPALFPGPFSNDRG
jgi:hypothetical protein